MAVKTSISEADFVQILSRYNLGTYDGFQTFANGAGQTTVLLKTSSQKAVLRYYENRSEEHVRFEVNLFNFLKGKDYPVPAIIPDSNGNMHSQYKDKPYLLLEYVEGAHPDNPNELFNEEQASEVIKVVAQLHTLTQGYKPDYFDTREEFTAQYGLKEYLMRERKTDKEEREGWLREQFNELAFSTELPRGLCHADLNYGNFLLKEGKIVAVLDFDISFYSYVIYDVAGLIYWWAMPPKEGFNKERASFILNKYAEHRPLTPLEKVHIYDALKLIILLGISWSEENEFEEGKNAVNALNQIGRANFNSAHSSELI